MTNPEDIELRLTCGACPEQYDAYIGTEQVGYLRLRHGAFRVDVPICGGRTILECAPDGDGEFRTEERHIYLTAAKAAIAAAMNQEKSC